MPRHDSTQVALVPGGQANQGIHFLEGGNFSVVRHRNDVKDRDRGCHLNDTPSPGTYGKQIKRN